MMPRQADVVEAGKPFTIDGSASKDADGDELQYRWTLSGLGSPIDLSNQVSDTVIVDSPGKDLANSSCSGSWRFNWTRYCRNNCRARQ